MGSRGLGGDRGAQGVHPGHGAQTRESDPGEHAEPAPSPERCDEGPQDREQARQVPEHCHDHGRSGRAEDVDDLEEQERRRRDPDEREQPPPATGQEASGRFGAGESHGSTKHIESLLTRRALSMRDGEARARSRLETMDMSDPNRLLERLLRLSDEQMVFAYLSYAHDITVVARETYPEVTAIPNRALARACNETLHQLSGHPRRLLAGTSDALSNRSFAEMIVESAVQRGWVADLERAVRHSESLKPRDSSK